MEKEIWSPEHQGISNWIRTYEIFMDTLLYFDVLLIYFF